MSVDGYAGDVARARIEQSERDPSAVVRKRFRAWAKEQARAILSDDLIREFDDQPIGQHSDARERLMTWLRMADLAERDIIIALDDGSYAIGRVPGSRGGATRIVDEFRAPTLLDAEREVFRRRIAALRAQ